MKSFFALAIALAASMASAGVIITPIKANQVVAKNDGDCFFGVTTPNGCGCVAISFNTPNSPRASKN